VDIPRKGFSEFKQKMEKGRNLVPSGVEPVDKLSGGLESGKLYLVHGEGPSKSLFGYQFLIEGLKRGEHAALIINYSPEDAVRWFARLGYDCLEDIYSGRLVILECAEENLDQIARMKQLSPVLRELRWLIGEKNPERVVFEPIGRLVSGEQGSAGTRSQEFAAWAGEIGSTSLLIANGRSEDLITDLLPLVTESFRFELKQEGGLTIRYLFFEKSPELPGQAIEADPFKGIFLVDRPLDPAVPARPQSAEEPPQESTIGASRNLPETGPEAVSRRIPDRDSNNQHDPFTDLISEILADVEGAQEPAHFKKEPPHSTKEPGGGEYLSPGEIAGGEVDPDFAEAEADHTPAVPGSQHSVGQVASPTAALAMLDEERTGIGVMVEDLLKPPAEQSADSEAPSAIVQVESIQNPQDPPPQAMKIQTGQRVRRVRPEDYNVLLIAGDAQSAERVMKSLAEYHVEQAPDGVSGLAKLISFKPDLVVLDTDMGAVDGFEMLRHIRANLDVPIIALSSSRLRASDRIRSAELGADYYLTKPFSHREMRQRARQLIARYRQIDEWITGITQAAEPAPDSEAWRTDGPDTNDSRGVAGNPAGLGAAEAANPATGSQGLPNTTGGRARGASRQMMPGIEPESDRASMLAYPEFVRRIEQLVEITIDGDAWFSVVGCRLNHNSDGRATARTAALVQMVPDLIRNCDVASVNQAGDLMILLTDADKSGAKAFTARLQETVHGKFNTDPVIWVRTFPFSGEEDD
jgi:CheY-like chemotaxis protein/KaiC/GvpD/RAD55 family RecA-like ATPase